MSEIGIGDAAQLTQTHPSTLRLWEQHGLISPERTPSGHRIYSPADISRIRAIKRLRMVDGLNMSAIKRVLSEQLEPQTTAINGENDKSSDLRDLGMRYRRARLKLGISLRDAAERSG